MLQFMRDNSRPSLHDKLLGLYTKFILAELIVEDSRLFKVMNAIKNRESPLQDSDAFVYKLLEYSAKKGDGEWLESYKQRLFDAKYSTDDVKTLIHNMIITRENAREAWREVAFDVDNYSGTS